MKMDPMDKFDPFLSLLQWWSEAHFFLKKTQFFMLGEGISILQVEATQAAQ